MAPWEPERSCLRAQGPRASVSPTFEPHFLTHRPIQLCDGSAAGPRSVEDRARPMVGPDRIQALAEIPENPVDLDRHERSAPVLECSPQPLDRDHGGGPD